MSGVKHAAQANQLKMPAESAVVAKSGAIICGHHSTAQEKSSKKLAGIGDCNGQSEKIIKEGRLSERIFTNQYLC